MLKGNSRGLNKNHKLRRKNSLSRRKERARITIDRNLPSEKGEMYRGEERRKGGVRKRGRFEYQSQRGYDDAYSATEKKKAG